MTKKQKWSSFTLDDKISVIHDVVIRKEKLADVAIRYHRTQGYISNLVKKMKLNRNVLQELMEKREEQLRKEKMVQEVI